MKRELASNSKLLEYAGNRKKMMIAKDFQVAEDAELSNKRPLTDETLGLLRDYIIKDFSPTRDPIEGYHRFLAFKDDIYKTLNEAAAATDIYEFDVDEILSGFDTKDFTGSVNSMTELFEESWKNVEELEELTSMFSGDFQIEAPGVQEFTEPIKRPISSGRPEERLRVKRLKSQSTLNLDVTCSKVTEYSPIQQPEESLLFIIEGELDDRVKCEMMVDSGAFANLIDVDFLIDNFTNDTEMMARVFELTRKRVLDGALKGTCHETTQGVQLKVKSGISTQEISFFIIDKQCKTPPIILGLPFIRKNWKKLNWDELKIKSIEGEKMRK